MILFYLHSFCLPVTLSILQVKSDGSSLVGLSLEFSSSMNERKSVLLASQGRTLVTMNRFSSKYNEVIMPRRVTMTDISPGWVIQESSISMNGYTLTDIHAVCYNSKPEVSQLRLNSGADVQDNILSRSPKEYFAVLGHITMKTAEQNAEFPPPTSWLLEGQYIKWTSGSEGSKILSVKLIWKQKKSIDSSFSKYNIYVEKLAKQAVRDSDGGLLKGVAREYLGVAEVEAFYVSDLVVPSSTSSVKFIIQVSGVDGTCQKLDDSPSFQLNFEG